MKCKLQYTVVLAGLVLSGAAVAAEPAAKMSRSAYEAAKARIEAQYESDRKLCRKVQGQARKVCRAQAEGRADALKAELEAKYKPSPEAWREAKEVTAEANYEVALARCEALKGKAEDRCERQAELARDAAIRQAKVEKVKETGGAFATRNGRS